MEIESLLFVILYIIFLIIGKIRYLKIVEKIVDPIVILLIFSISYWAGQEILGNQIITLLFTSVVFSILSILITYFSGFIINFYSLIKNMNSNSKKLRLQNTRNDKRTILKYMVPFIIGWIVGIIFHVNTKLLTSLIDYELYALASILGYTMSKGFNLKLVLSSGKDALLSIIITIIGDLVLALMIFLFHITSFSIAIAITLASGWYSYVGPLIAVSTNPYLGTLAFLINFLREQFTYVFIPLLLKLKFEPRSAIAVGGATSMDTTLPLYIETLGKEYALSAMVSGVILTTIIPIIVPLFV
ncbi:MAG: lysine exporter LysO family protein [Saccharolobus sp.]